MRILLAPGTMSKAPDSGTSLEDESRKSVSKEATVKTGGLSLVRMLCRGRWPRHQPLMQLYWFPVVSLVEEEGGAVGVC